MTRTSSSKKLNPASKRKLKSNSKAAPDSGDKKEDIKSRYDRIPFAKKIPKPPGEPGRAPPRGYNTQDAIGLSSKGAIWNGILRVAHAQAGKYLDLNCSLKYQDSTAVLLACFKVAERYRFLVKYQNLWPVRDIFQKYLQNHKSAEKKRRASEAEEESLGISDIEQSEAELDSPPGTPAKSYRSASNADEDGGISCSESLESDNEHNDKDHQELLPETKEKTFASLVRKSASLSPLRHRSQRRIILSPTPVSDEEKDVPLKYGLSSNKTKISSNKISLGRRFSSELASLADPGSLDEHCTTTRRRPPTWSPSPPMPAPRARKQPQPLLFEDTAGNVSGTDNDFSDPEDRSHSFRTHTPSRCASVRDGDICPRPGCNDPIPSIPSERLAFLVQEKTKRKPANQPRHVWERHLETIDNEIHFVLRTDIVREQGRLASYPSIMDYEGLAIRALRLRPQLDIIIKEGLSGTVASELIFVSRCAEAAAEDGARPSFSIAYLNKESRGAAFYSQFESIRHIICHGYFGKKGNEIVLHALTILYPDDAEIWTQVRDSMSIVPFTPLAFRNIVLVQEALRRLLCQDFNGMSIEKAQSMLNESEEYGTVCFDRTEDDIPFTLASNRYLRLINAGVEARERHLANVFRPEPAAVRRQPRPVRRTQEVTDADFPPPPPPKKGKPASKTSLDTARNAKTATAHTEPRRSLRQRQRGMSWIESAWNP